MDTIDAAIIATECKTDSLRNLRVTITRNADGAISISPSGEWRGFSFHRYWWEEGNAACDCNRDDWFHRWRGEQEGEDARCGEGKYRVKINDSDTGETLYEESAP